MEVNKPVSQVAPPSMVNDPLVAKSGKNYNPATGAPRDPWVAEHPYRQFHEEREERNARGGFRGRGRGGRGGFDNTNQGDIANRRRNYTMGIPDPNRPRDLTGIPEFDQPKIEAAKKAKETVYEKDKREQQEDREENETPDQKQSREQTREKRKKERKKERLLDEQKHIAIKMEKPLQWVQALMKGEVPDDLTEEPPPPIPDRVEPDFKHPHKDSMNAAYRIKFPRSFFLLYEFMRELNKEDPLNELVKNGMQMVGPYEELHKCYTSQGYQPDPAKCVYNHMRYRYYFDPPELLTCIISIRDHWHVGLYSDLITETPSICASNDQRTGALYSVAANLFGAVKIVLYRRTQTLIVRSLYEALIAFCEGHDIDFNRKTPDFKRRDMLIVNKTINEVGFIIDDYNGMTDTKEEDLLKFLKNMKTAHNDEMAKFHMKPLKEIYYEAMKECDDDSPGMALELGLNFFADGNPVLSDLIRQLLISAYTRSNRDLFAEIIDVHLKDRRKTLVSRLDLTGTITFAQAPMMRGPAYDKSAVGVNLPGSHHAITEKPAEPKWEGVKVVRDGPIKRYGQFGSGGRRDALKAAEAKKAKIAALGKPQKASKWGEKAGGASDW